MSCIASISAWEAIEGPVLWPGTAKLRAPYPRLHRQPEARKIAQGWSKVTRGGISARSVSIRILASALHVLELVAVWTVQVSSVNPEKFEIHDFLRDVKSYARINDGPTLGSPRGDGITYTRLIKGAMMRSLTGLTTTQLDEIPEPIVELLGDPRDCDHEAKRIVERLAYLISRGPARDGRAEFLGSMSFGALMLALEEARHGSSDEKSNWFTLGQMFRMKPREVRDLFSTPGRDS